MKSISQTQSYTNYFADALIAEAEVDKDIVAIHAAMGGGTGLNYFLRRFPTRCFDVGIAEQHAVTFAAGLACEGLKPFCAIYSSFLQRAYDQASHCPHFSILSFDCLFHIINCFIYCLIIYFVSCIFTNKHYHTYTVSAFGMI